MKSLRNNLWILVSALAVFIVFNGCGVSQKKLDEAQSRIKALGDKGVPDSLLTEAKLFLFKANGAKKTGNTAIAKREMDSMMIYLERAEAECEATMKKLKPYVDSMRISIKKRKEGLAGLQLKFADSIVTFIDSFTNKDWLRQARDKCVMIDTLLPQLHKDEKAAIKVKPKMVGAWVSSRVPKRGYKAVETRKFTFKKDGKFEAVEEMNGQTHEFLKEYWKFLSWGKWMMKGDTAMIFIEREKCTKQTFWNYKEKDGRKQWVKTDAPTYDTTLTSGSKDRYMTYGYLRENFKKQ